jgi:hypothetical protein
MRQARHILASMVLAGPLGAQATDTLVVAGDSTARAAAVRSHGFVAFPITVLAPLGAEITAQHERVEVRLFGRLFWFRPGYGTFGDNGTMESLHHGAFDRDGVLHLPEGFFAQWLPARFPRRLRYDDATRTLTRSRPVRVSTWPVPPRRPPPGSAGAHLARDSVSSGSILATEERLLAAPEPSEPRHPLPAEPAVSLEMHMRMSGFYSENFFQAPSGGTPVEMVAATAEARMLLRMRGPRLNVHARAHRTEYLGFAPSVAALGGFDWSGRWQSIEASGGYQRRSPRLSVGEQTEFANTVHGAGAYGVRLPGRLQVSALGHYYDMYLHARATQSQFYGVGGALRYRGFGYRLTPEVGHTESRLVAPSAAEEYRERTQWATLRAIPFVPVYVDARYRVDVRSYTIGDRAASNYGREDTRTHWTVSTDVRLGPRLWWGTYYTHQHGRSTRPGRTFTTQSITSGVAYRVW